MRNREVEILEMCLCMYVLTYSFTSEKLQSSTTLYMLLHEAQALPAATKEEILFVPHYDTLIQCGTFEYYTDGKESLRKCLH